MGDILEFDNARTPLHLELLRAAGLPSPAHWRVEGPVEGLGVNPRFDDAYLWAVPHLVASCRGGEVCVVHFLPGPTPIDVSDARANKAMLDAIVVRGALERQGCRVTQLMVWLVFDDGDRIELRAEDSFTSSLVSRAQTLARGFGRGSLSTARVSHLL